jgi:hypothetical protein
MKIMFLVSVLVAALGISANALPFPLTSEQSPYNLIVPAADGCWLGWHRNPNGGCSRDRYGLFGSGIDSVPGPYYPTGPNVCAGGGMYNVCNVFGYCWWVCR